jgi:hypothetical protein
MRIIFQKIVLFITESKQIGGQVIAWTNHSIRFKDPEISIN